MNRTIKFRGIAVCNCEWVYGNYIHSKRFSGMGCEYRIHEQDTGIESDIEPETLGQFTGLYDKSGKEIYEGDILRANIRNEDMVFEVYYNVKHCLWQAKHKEIGETMALQNMFFRHSETEVIGNIHDNKELLTLIEKQ